MFSRMLATGLVVITAAAVVCPAVAAEKRDPYLWLEQVHSPRAMAWVRAENARTLGVLEKDPRYAGLYRDALAIAQAKDRIPAPTELDGGIFNFWQDAEHVRGIWRRTSLESYRSPAPRWTTVLDLDALAATQKANWFLKDVTCVEPSEQRCLLSLSDGGEDAVTIREFDLKSMHFAADGFTLPRGKQQAAWENDHTLLVAREWAPGDLTRSGYPFIVKRLARGQPLSAAREVFRGTAMDGGYGVSPVVMRDGAGNQATLINRPLSTFESENYLVSGDRVLKLALPKKVEIQGLVGGSAGRESGSGLEDGGQDVRTGFLDQLRSSGGQEGSRTPEAGCPVRTGAEGEFRCGGRDPRRPGGHDPRECSWASLRLPATAAGRLAAHAAGSS